MIKFKPHLHKRTTMILLYLFLLLIIVISILSLSQRIWSDYDVSNGKLFNDSKINIDNAFLQISSKINTSSSTDKLNDITQVQSELMKEVESYCEVSPLIKWQNFVSQYSDKINDCEQQKHHLDQLLSAIGDIVSYLKAEQKLSVIILDVNGATIQNNQSDKWNLIDDFWRKAAADTLKLAGPTQFKDVQTLAGSDLNKIADAWKQLSDANEAKNRQQFETAQSSLSQAYTSLGEISDSSEAKVKVLIDNLNSDYQKAY